MFDSLGRLDFRLFFVVNNGLSETALAPVFDAVFWLFATVGNGTGLLCWALIGLGVADRSALRRHWGWIILSVIVGAAAIHALKYGIARPRPLTAFAPLLVAGERYIHVVGEALHHRSFPSGHAQAAASVFAYLWRLYPRYAVCWGLGIGLAALGRVYVGAHFPADVLVGACLGSASALAVFAVARRREGRAND